MRVALVVAVTSAVLLIGGCSMNSQTAAPSPASSSPGQRLASRAETPRLFDCVQEMGKVRPLSFLIACGDGAVQADQVVWQSWGSSQATGTAEITINDCTPDCARGADHVYPAAISVADVHQIHGADYYSRLSINYGHQGPDGAHNESWPLGP